MSGRNGSRPTADLLVRDGLVVNAQGSRRAHVVVAGGLVQAVLPLDAELPPAERTLDAAGKLVLPGGVDPHCHIGQRLGEVSMLDDYAQATTAALWGGTTTIIDFAIPESGQSPLEAVHARLKIADRARCDYSLHGGVVSWDASSRRDLEAMAELGVLTTKVFTTYRDDVMADAATIEAVLGTSAALGGVTLIHAEQNHLIEDAQSAATASAREHARWHATTRPEEAELEAVRRTLAMAEATGAAVYYVHQSTAAAVDLVTSARARGVRAYSETCPHYLALDDTAYASTTPERFVCCPPLRSRATADELRRRVVAGHVHTVGSDHCCYSTEQKLKYVDQAVDVPNGLPGVESRLTVTFQTLVVEAGLSLEDFVSLVSTRPAQLNGLRAKGYIAPGADADLVVFDPAAERVISASSQHMATDYSPYEGTSMRGWPEAVVSGGRVVVDADGFHDPGPVGRMLPATAQLDQHQPLPNAQSGHNQTRIDAARTVRVTAGRGAA